MELQARVSLGVANPSCPVRRCSWGDAEDNSFDVLLSEPGTRYVQQPMPNRAEPPPPVYDTSFVATLDVIPLCCIADGYDTDDINGRIMTWVASRTSQGVLREWLCDRCGKTVPEQNAFDFPLQFLRRRCEYHGSWRALLPYTRTGCIYSACVIPTPDAHAEHVAEVNHMCEVQLVGEGSVDRGEPSRVIDLDPDVGMLDELGSDNVSDIDIDQDTLSLWDR